MNDRPPEPEVQPSDEADLIEVRSLEEIPDFANEEEEARWWETHELSDELWAAGVQIGDPLLPPVRDGAARRRA